MSEFDDLDLSRRLRHLAGDDVDLGAANAELSGRVTRAKRRRAVAVGSGGTLAVMLVAVLGVVALRNEPIGTLQPADPGVLDDGSTTTGPDISPSTSDVVVTTVVTGTTVVTVPSPGTTVAGPVTPTISTVPTTPRPTVPTSVPGSTATSIVGPGGLPGTTTAPTTQTSPAETTPPETSPPAPTTSTFAADGGSITVRLENGALTLVGISPNGGFTAETTEAGATRVEVRFESASHESRIRVDVVDGAMSPTIEERPSDDTATSLDESADDSNADLAGDDTSTTITG